MYFIDASDLSHEYFRRDGDGNVESIYTALNHINLKVHPGQFISIVGHNGSGKSTLAKHLNGLLHPSEGSVFVDGMDASDSSNGLSIRKTVGMVFQNPDNQIVSGIVEEDVGFGPENLGIPTDEILRRVDEALNSMDMQSVRKASPNHLSGGQKQRVAIAGILAMRPKAIIFDESTSMLDPMGRQELIDTAHKLNQEYGITIILITHYMEEVIGSDYVYVLEDGQIILEGTDRQIFVQANFLREHYLDVPPIVQIAEGLRKQGINIPTGIMSRKELVDAIKEIRYGSGN